MINEFSYINNCDIIFLTESWLKDIEMTKYQLYIKGYGDVIYKNRITVGGGLLIYYKEGLIINRLHQLEHNNLENIVIELICSQAKKFIFNLIYRSPSSNNKVNDYIIDNMYDSYNFSIERNYTGIYFLGDFNYPNISWSHSERNNHIFYDTITQLGLCQLVNEPTRLNNILDLIITDSPGFTKNVTINPPIKNCDHNVILFQINYHDKLINILPRKIYKYKEASWDKINEELSQVSWIQNFIGMSNIEEMVDYLQQKIYEQMNKNIPNFILSNTKRKNPWVTYEIKKYIILQRRFKKKYFLDPTNYNKIKYENTKFYLDKILKNAKQQYYTNIFQNLKNKNYTSKKFWNICNILLKRKMRSNVGDIVYNKKVYRDDKDKVRIIGDYFAEQVTNEDGLYDNNIDYNDNLYYNIKYSFPEITKNMILEIMKNINTNTSNGPDNINNIFLKETRISLVQPLEYIYNYSLIHKVYPKQWKKSNWTPLHKKDSIFKRENYRPISLCNNLGKILDKIVFKTLYLETNNLLNKYNYGFKRKSSCQHNLSMLLIYENLDKNCDSLVLFLDVVKAFNKVVDHKILLRKLNELGVSKDGSKWFKNYLQDRYSKCVIHGYESRLYHIQTSVTQGSVLATLLWSIFAYDITENIISSPYIFADDTALVEKIERDDVQNAFNVIQFDIDQLLEWAYINKINFSIDKTKYIIISNSHLRNYPSLYMNDIELERKNTYKQLGLFIDQNLNWESHINYIIHKTQKIIHIFKLVRKRIDFITSEKIYKSLIASIIDYCCMFYINATQKNIKRITRLIYHCALIVTRGTRFMSEKKLLNELGWNDFKERTNYLSITMFGKIKITETPKIIFNAFFKNLPKKCGKK